MLRTVGFDKTKVTAKIPIIITEGPRINGTKKESLSVNRENSLDISNSWILIINKLKKSDRISQQKK